MLGGWLVYGLFYRKLIWIDAVWLRNRFGLGLGSPMHRWVNVSGMDLNRCQMIDGWMS